MTSCRGTSRFANHIFKSWRRVSRRYGFAEYDGPPLESLDLYLKKSGSEIMDQLFNFEDKAGRHVTLRPEMTPTLARILAGLSRGMSKPIRWFSIPQLFRYERTQRGRLREHFQLNADIVGEAGVAADAEVLAAAIDSVRDLGLGSDDFVARVNDRRLVSAVLTALGVRQEQQASCLAVIDKAGRTRAETTRQRLRETGLDDSAVSVLSELAADGSWGNLRRCFSGHEAVSAAMGPLEEHRSILKAMGLDSFVEFDFKIVRGLAYYTGIVFELFDRDSELRAICGGGRYDRLLELVGGEPLPAVGFGMGDVVLGELLRTRGFLPAASPPADYFVAWIGREQRAAALGAAHRLRQGGLSVLYSLKPDMALGKQLRAAGRARGESCADYRLRRGCGRQRNRTELANRTTGNPTDGFLVDGGRSGAVSQKGTGTSLNAGNRQVAREVMNRAIRRLSILEGLIFIGAAGAAALGGLLAAFLANSAFGWSFWASWLVASLLLLILPGLFVWGREVRGSRSRRSGKSAGSDNHSNPRQDR